MDVFGIPMGILHGMVVEEHTGIVIFIILSLVIRVLGDLTKSKIKMVSDQIPTIHSASDTIAFYGSAAAIFFLIVSGVTGYLIQPYSSITSEPILLNKSLFALAALFFWCAFFFNRYWFGPNLWSHRGLYLVQIVTALLGVTCIALAASIGAELTLGQSVLEPVYNYFNFSWSNFMLGTLEIGVTAVLVVIGIAIALVLKPKSGNQKKQTK